MRGIVVMQSPECMAGYVRIQSYGQLARIFCFVV